MAKKTGTAEADKLEGLQGRIQVEAPDTATAIEKTAAEFNVPAKRLMAVRQ
jgi:hypothetical protein